MVSRVVNWVLIGVAFLVVLVAATLVGGVVWLRSSWGHDFVRGQIIQRLGDAVTGEVRLGGVEGDVLQGVVLRDFALVDSAGVPLIAAERVQVRYGLRPFLDKRIAIQRLRMVRPEIHLIRGPDGRWNFQTLFKPREPSPPDPTPGWGSWLEIQAIEIVEGTAEVALADGGPVLDWSENRFLDVNGTLELGLFSRDRMLRRFAARDLSFRTTAPELVVRELDGTGLWTPDSLALRSINLVTPGTEVHADGQLTLGERDSFALDIAAPRVSLDEVRRFFPQVRLGGTARFEGSLTGPSTRPTVVVDEGRVDTGRSVAAVTGTVQEIGGGMRLDLDARLDPLDPADARLFLASYPLAQRVAGTVRVEGPPRRLDVAGDLRAPAGGFTVDGALDLTGGAIGYQVAATSRDLDVGALVGRPTVDLTLTGSYLLEGRGTGERDLRARFEAQLDRSQVYRWDLLALVTRGVIEGRTYTADTLLARTGQTLVRGEGVFGLAGNGAIEADLALDSENLEEVWPGLGDFSGHARATARLSGTYQGFDVAADLVAGDLHLAGVTADSFAGRVTMEEVGGPMRMAGEGTFHQMAVAGIEADTAAVTLDYRDRMMTVNGTFDHPGEPVTTLAGMVDFTGPEAVVRLEAFTYSSPEATWQMAEGSGLTVVGGDVRFDGFRLTQDGQTIRADGRLALQGSSDLTVVAEDVGLREVGRLLGQPAGDWEGRADVRLRLEGSRQDPRLMMEGQVSEGLIRGFRFQSVRGTVDYADQAAAVDMTVVAPTEGHEIVLTGRVPVDLALVGGVDRLPNRPIDLHVEGRGTDLSLLGAFVPGLTELEGPIDVEIDVRGTTQAPRFEGYATLGGGRMTIPATGMTYRDIQGRVQLTNDRIMIENLRGSDGARGTFRIGGEVAMQNLQLGDFDVSIEATELQVVDLSQQDVQVNGTVELTGTTQTPVLAGRVSVDEAIYRLPEQTGKDVIDLDEAVVYVEIPGAAPPPAERSPGLWDRTRIELDVIVTDDAILTASNARIEIAGDLSLFKPAGTRTPTFSGTLDVRRGYYEELGMRFAIEEGEVFFYGTPELNPGLHIVANQTIDNVEGVGQVNIRITLGGTLNNPTIDLSSTPAFDKSEIISLALFGTPSPSAGQQREFTDTVRGLFVGQAAASLQAALAEEVGLDLLEVGQREDAGGDTASLFRVGKYVSPDVLVTYEGEMGGEEDQQTVGLRYNVTDLLTLQVSAGTLQTGVDLFWEFTY